MSVFKSLDPWYSVTAPRLGSGSGREALGAVPKGGGWACVLQGCQLHCPRRETPQSPRLPAGNHRAWGGGLGADTWRKHLPGWLLSLLHTHCPKALDGAQGAVANTGTGSVPSPGDREARGKEGRGLLASHLPRKPCPLCSPSVFLFTQGAGVWVGPRWAPRPLPTSPRASKQEVSSLHLVLPPLDGMLPLPPQAFL